MFKRIFFDPTSRTLNYFVWVVLCCAVPLAALERDLGAHVTEISSGLALRIVAAGLLSQGQLPYVEFWDWSQPIVFEVLKYPYILAMALADKWIGFRPEYLLPQGIIFLLCISVIFSLVLYYQGPFKQAAESDREKFALGTAACVVALALTALVTRFQFGELQYLLIIAITPWLLLRWYRVEGITIARPLALFAGAWAGLCACFDIPYIPLFIFVELSILFHYWRWRVIWSTEWLAFIVVAAANWLFITHMEPSVARAFWQWTMPIKLLSYKIQAAGLFGPLSCPKRMDILCSAASAAMIALPLARVNGFYTILTALMFGGFLIYLLEQDGLSQGLIITVFAATAIAACVLLQGLAELHKKINAFRAIPSLGAINQTIILLTVIVATAATLRSLNLDRDHLSEEITSGFKHKEISVEINVDSLTKVGDKINCISGAMETIYPYLLFSGRKPGGYLLWARPLYLLNDLKDRNELSGPMKDFYNTIISSLLSEVQQSNSQVVLVRDRTLFDTYGQDAFIDVIRTRYETAPKDGKYFSHGNHQPHEYVGLSHMVETFVQRKAPPK